MQSYIQGDLVLFRSIVSVLCNAEKDSSLSSDNYKGVVCSTKNHLSIEDINVRAPMPTISPTALVTWPTNKYPIKIQTAFVVGSWSHDRRNTRTEQTKLADPCRGRENESYIYSPDQSRTLIMDKPSVPNVFLQFP